MKHLIAAAACALTVWAVDARDASAAVVINFVESGADVIGTLSGSLDITGLATFSAGQFGNGVAPSLGGIYFGPPTPTATAALLFFGGYTFGSGAYTPQVSTGDTFAFIGADDLLFLPAGYSGGALSASMTFTGTDFATLGITPGTQTFGLPSADTIKVTFQSAVVPVPPAIAALGSALLGLGLWGRRRRG